MGLPELKTKIQLQVETADEKILLIVSSVFDTYFKTNDISEATIKELLEISEKEYEEGKCEPYSTILMESKEKYFGK